MVEKHTEIDVSNPVEMLLLLHFVGLVARLCIVAVGGKVWKQTDPIMVSLNLSENSWVTFPSAAVLEVSGCPVCCLIVQTGYIFCCQMYCPLYEINPNLFRDFD